MSTENSSEQAASVQVVTLLPSLKAWLLPDLQMRRRLWPVGVALAYILINYALGGLNADHVIVSSVSLLDFYNQNTRRFLKYFFPLILTGAIYDSMRYYYWWGITGRIHVTEHYEFDKLLFGINDGLRRLSLPEYFETRTNKLLDIVCGFAYLIFVAEYLAAAFWLFFKKKFDLLRVFGFSFLGVNLIGFATYFIYPAAPPWYLTLHGFGEARLDVKSNAAGAVRFDEILGTSFFDQIYGRGIDVYGSIPSLHVAYPLLVAWIAWRERIAFIPAFAFYLVMCFSAVYLQHHHVIDILLGTSYAFLTIPLAQYVAKRIDARSPRLLNQESVEAANA